MPSHVTMSSMTKPGLTLCVILRVPPDGIAPFLAYEDAVLPILADHGGLLERRLRTESGTTEFHLIWFPSVSHFDAFRVDPRRSAHTELLTQSGAISEILVVEDAAPSLGKS
jgi:hypothetical protein